MPKSISELDPNFQALAVEDGVAWHGASTLALEGLGWPQESEAFCRLPNRAENLVRAPVWDLSRHSAGVCVRFLCDAPKISARWNLRSENLAMPHMPATGVSGLDLYARDVSQNWRWCGVGIPQSGACEATLLEDIAPTGAHEYCLYAPLYNGISKLEIGVPQGAKLKIAPPRKNPKPIGFYGTSVVQGGCAARPGMAYPAIVARTLDYAHLNLGFSGNGQSEPEVAALLSELDVAAWVLDPVPNMEADWVRERIAHLVETIRSAHASTPILLVECIDYQNDWIRNGFRMNEKNRALRETFEILQKSGLQFLHYIDGKKLLGDDSEATVDGIHATDIGFVRMAGVLAPALQAALAAA